MNDLEFDIADCIARVRLGDQEAARVLVENLSPFVTGIVRRKLPRGAAEEDLVQEIFSKVFEKLGQYRGEVQKVLLREVLGIPALGGAISLSEIREQLHDL